MSDFATKQCNQCKGLKKEINHWWKAVSLNAPVFRLEQASNLNANSTDLPADLCGINCAHKWMDQWIAEPQNAYKAELVFDINTTEFV